MNPYEPPRGVEPLRHWWSGFPVWLKRFAVVCLLISVVLSIVNVPIVYTYWDSSYGRGWRTQINAFWEEGLVPK